MTTNLTLRSTKGSALTHAEMDANLTALQTTADAAAAATDTLTANKAEAAALGVANTDQNMGSFTGSTISDNVSAKAGMQALETAVETKANATAVGVAASAANMGAYTGSTIPDNETAKQNIQSLETAHETLITDLADTGGAALIGTANFTGNTIPDGSNSQEAMQALETGLEQLYVNVKSHGATGDGTTDDQTAVAAAVAAAYAAGDWLFWPDGTYLTTATIPNFHDVKHFGPGVVKRGSDLFAVEPKEGDTNNLYVATTGDNANDGLSSSQPRASLQGAFDALTNYWPLDGKWVIQLAAGTYSTSTNRKSRLGPANESESSQDDDNYTADGMSMRNMLTVQGADVGYIPASAPTPSPTTIFEGGGAAVIGIQLERGVKVLVKDIMFQNYSGSSSSHGISADGNCWLRTENVHADTCAYGIAAYNHSQLEVKGGTIDACTVAGIRSIFNCKHEIGNQSAGAVGQGPFITNCTTGFIAQEGSTGHSDYVSYSDNTIGIDAQVNARVNANGSDFKSNTVAIRASDSSVLLTGVTFNTGTVDANTENLRIHNGGAIPDENANAWRTIDRLTTTFTTAAATTEQTAYTATLLADRFTSVPGSTYFGKVIKFRCAGSITGTAGTKTVRMRIGGTLLAGIAIDADAQGGFEVEGHVYMTGSATQKNIIRSLAGLGTNRAKVGYAASTINTASSSNLSFTATVQLANSADSVAVEVMELEIQG